MIPETDREQQLDTILDVASGDAEALLAAANQIQRRDEELSAALRLLARLAKITPAKSEIDSARLRVGQRLTRDILADPENEDAQKRALRPLRLSEPPEITLPAVETVGDAVNTPTPTGSRLSFIARARRMPMRRRVIFGAVAAAALFLAIGMGLTTASAQSLPESPLYGIKLAEESVLLALPVDQNAHAQILGMIAERRLNEAQAEASAHHDAEVTALLSQYNSAMRQLIMLAASVNAQHGDSSEITAQIAQVIQTQQAIQRSAAALSDPSFVKALSQSADAIAMTLKQQNVTLPTMNGGAGQNTGKDHGAATATPTVKPTPTPPGSSGSHGRGHGRDGGNSGNGIGNGG